MRILPLTTLAQTATGGFLLGFRRLRSGWQQDPHALARWARDHRFGFVDFDREDDPLPVAILAGAGLRLGSVDLLDWNGYQNMIAPDSTARRATVAATVAHIETSAAAGAAVFFAVTIPADRELSRAQNFAHFVESFATLAPVLERTGSRVAIEGWPGPGAVCCTPETFRAFFREIGSDRFGVNYDPSHLLRMGIDPLRFLEEFSDRVFHVHAKDTVLSAEDLYTFGHEQPATFAQPRGWGGACWRYTIPGRGPTDWAGTFRVLEARGYAGLVSIELEDDDFNGTEAGEKRGLTEARDFLAGC